jgi:hypothetical protein
MLRKLSEGQRRTIAHWAMEFVVVVGGVLLALWLQELVTSADKRSDAKAAEAAIRDEVDANLLILILQDAVANCRHERLEQIEANLESDGPTAPILSNWGLTASQQQPKHPSVYGFFAVDVTDTAWRSAIANGSASAMKPERFRSIADIYATFDAVRKALASDNDAADTLQVLSYQVPLTPELRGSLIKAYFNAHANLGILTEGLSAHATADQMRALGWDDEKHVDVLISGVRRDMSGFGFKFKPCAKPFVNPFGTNARDRGRS